MYGADVVHLSRIAGCIVVAVLSGCGREAVVPPAPSESGAGSPDVAQAWVGKWHGPEGTFLEIQVTGGRYTLEIANLDSSRTFAAEPDDRGLSFERRGVRETVRATDGTGTGMKWLADKTDCLVIKAGEGFCRD